VGLTADVGACLAAAKPWAKWEKVPPVVGQLRWTGTAAAQGQRIRLDGQGELTGVRVGSGDKAFTDERIVLAQRAVLDRQAEQITVEEMRVTSKVVSLTAAGTIKRFRSDMLLDLTGSYQGSWEQVTALVHKLAPQTAEDVALTGSPRGMFKIAGPARQPKLRPTFHDLSAATEVTWASATLYGMKFGAATFRPALGQGQLTVPETTIAASEGTLRMSGVLDLRSEPPVLRITKKRQLAQRVRITKQFGRQTFGHINPLFGGAGSIQGWVSMEAQEVEIPLGKGLEKQAKGTAWVQVDGVTLQPNPLLRVLLKLGGVAESDNVPVKLSPLHLVVRDGRVQYKDMRVSLSAAFDPVFSGSVGFDDRVDLTVSLPVTSQLLSRLGVRGGAADYARILAGNRVDVPLTGTLLAARLDLAKVDVRPLVDRAVKALLAEKFRKQLGQGGDGKKEPSGEPKKEPHRKTPAGGVLDTLMDRLRKPKKKRR